MKALATLAALFAAVFAAAAPAAADKGGHTIAIIGDAPYGDDQIEDFPALLAEIDADSDITELVHVGDIKAGSTECSTARFLNVFDELNLLQMPVILTLGDNEWTDCHRSRAGKYDPLERLAELRDIFFSWPGLTLGGKQRFVWSQAFNPRFADFPENQLWVRSRVVFSAVHVVGSANGLRPWFVDDAEDDLEDDPIRREAEVEAREKAGLYWLVKTFLWAWWTRAEAVVVFMHADTFIGGSEGFVPTVQLLADLAADFGKPVLLIQGDSHTWAVDKPLENGSELYGITRAVPNLTRIVVEGATTKEWLKLSITPGSPEVFSWQRMMR